MESEDVGRKEVYGDFFGDLEWTRRFQVKTLKDHISRNNDRVAILVG